jgi:hypothetical protein
MCSKWQLPTIGPASSAARRPQLPNDGFQIKQSSMSALICFKLPRNFDLP